METGEILDENRKSKGMKNRKVEREETVLLLCLTSIYQPVWLGRP